MRLAGMVTKGFIAVSWIPRVLISNWLCMDVIGCFDKVVSLVNIL